MSLSVAMSLSGASQPRTNTPRRCFKPVKHFLHCLVGITSLLSACGIKTDALQNAHAQAQPLFLHLFIPFDDKMQGPKRIATVPVHVSRSFAAGALSGVVEARDSNYCAKVEAECEGTSNSFEGILTLEKPILPRSMCCGAVFTLGVIVLSTNMNCSLDFSGEVTR